MKNFLGIIKLIVIIVLFAIIAILNSQWLLYDYSSNDKVASEPVQYKRTDKIKEALESISDNTTQNGSIDFSTDEEYTTGKNEVTNGDLDKYEKIKEYVPGKVNPFQDLTQENSNSENVSINNGSSDNKIENKTEVDVNENTSLSTSNSNTTTKVEETKKTTGLTK